MLDEEEEDKPETLDEIKKKMKELFTKLDTLTHYHYTPQAIHADVKVIRNLPTISMEEVAPVAMSDATLLAPQEIADKKKGKYKELGMKIFENLFFLDMYNMYFN